MSLASFGSIYHDFSFCCNIFYNILYHHDILSAHLAIPNSKWKFLYYRVAGRGLSRGHQGRCGAVDVHKRLRKIHKDALRQRQERIFNKDFDKAEGQSEEQLRKSEEERRIDEIKNG